MTRRVGLALAAMLAVGGCSYQTVPTLTPLIIPTRAAPAQATPTEAPTPVLTPMPTSSATSEFLTFGDGAFIVGTGVKPGTYRTRVASPGCYWDRLSVFGGTPFNIFSNGGSDGPELVTISASDKGFISRGCGTWTTDLSAVVSPGSPLPAGAYIVGTDVMAGTYRSAANPDCYWERLCPGPSARSEEGCRPRNGAAAPSHRSAHAPRGTIWSRHPSSTPGHVRVRRVAAVAGPAGRSKRERGWGSLRSGV